MAEVKTTFKRAAKDTNYTVIANELIDDSRLSWKAKGIMMYFLRLPNDFTVYWSEIRNHSKDGKDSFDSGIKELKDFGYLERYAVRNPQGIIGHWETVIHESPIEVSPQPENPVMDKKPGTSPQPDYPEVDNPEVDNPLVENPQLLSTYSLPSTKGTNTTTADTHEEPIFESTQSPIELWQRTRPGGILKPIDAERMAEVKAEMLRLEMDADEVNAMLIIAINKAVDADAANFRYLGGIIKGWGKDKIKSVKDIQASETKHAQKPKRQKTWPQHAKKVETKPDYLQSGKESKTPEQLIAQKKAAEARMARLRASRNSEVG